MRLGGTWRWDVEVGRDDEVRRDVELGEGHGGGGGT